MEMLIQQFYADIIGIKERFFTMAKKVLYLDWPCFGKEDILETFSALGIEVISFFHDHYTERKDAAFDAAFDAAIEDADFVFSFNYYPLVSEGCKRHGIPYISIIYDSPQVAVFSYTIINPCNFVFIFDSELAQRLQGEGISTVYYLPLPVHPRRIKRMFQRMPKNPARHQADVSFVGSLYHEDHDFYGRLKGVSDYTRGYLEAIMDAQKKVYGYNFIEDVLTPDIVADMQKTTGYQLDRFGVQTLEYVFANYFIDRKITQLERIELLNAVAERFSLKLFTIDKNAPVPKAQNMGTADYYKEMPYIFFHSKINLNITLRSITSGIPLRGMDILNCGGFLLTNYQADFLRHFHPGEDYVYYEGKEDMLEKIEYYLSHEKERAEIAKNGQRMAHENYSYEKLFPQIFEIVFEVETV